MSRCTRALILFLAMGLPWRAVEAAPKALPCSQGFELSVLVSPANQGVGTAPVGLELSYQAAGRGLASRVHTQQISLFDRAQCENWQKNYWHHLKRVIFENKQAERSNLICRNVAQLRLRVGGHSESARVCLASADADGLTYGFQRFYEGTDLMVER